MGLTTRDMNGGMRFGTYISFACFAGDGALFVRLVVPETKDKMLIELDVYFGGDDPTLAAEDRARMERIDHELGLDNLHTIDDVDIDEKNDAVVTHEGGCVYSGIFAPEFRIQATSALYTKEE